MKKLAVCCLSIFAAISCGDSGDPAPSANEVGFVLLDLDARQTEVVLAIDGALVSGLTPEMVDPASEIFVGAGPDGFDLKVAPGEFVHVRGAAGDIRRLVVDRDIRADQLTIVAHEDAAASLAEELGASLQRLDDSRWTLEGPELLGQIASARIPDGIEQVLPVDIVLELPTTATGAEGPAHALVMAQADDLQIAPTMIAPLEPRTGVIGRWEASDYLANQDTHYRFVLEVEAVDGDPTRVRGRISSHYQVMATNPHWVLSSIQPAGVNRFVPTRISVDMEAVGSFDGEKFAFQGTSWRSTGGPMPHYMGYNLDHFQGALSEDGTMLKTLNNDGGAAVNHPVDFIRVQ